MTRVGTRLFAVLIAALLGAALLSACGSSSDSTESTAGEAQSEEKAKTKERAAEEKASSRQKSGSEGSGSSDESGESSSPENVAAPLKVSGGGSGQFRKGGDESIQNYGEESGESELREVAEIVHGFYVARAEEDWAKACSYLAKSNIEQLEQLGKQSPQLNGKGCAPVLKAFTRPLPAYVNREITYVDAGSFRHNSEQGFLIYRGPDKTAYAIPLRNEGGTWKVAGLSGSAIN